MPQSSMPPQPFEIGPQFFPSARQVVRVHPQTLVVPPPPHVSGGMHELQPHTLGTLFPPHAFVPPHLPQSSMPPHLSSIVPQFFPSATQVVLTHPQTFSTPPPPHVDGGMQGPQSSTLLQPSEMSPQFLPAAAHVAKQPASIEPVSRGPSDDVSGRASRESGEASLPPLRPPPPPAPGSPPQPAAPARPP